MTLSFDAEQPVQTPPQAHSPHVRVTRPAHATVTPLAMGDSDSTPGRIQLTTRCVTIDGKPWIPVMGEYHFSRDLPSRWERELRKMKAGGINVLATYMIWIIHEEVEGELRWDGHRDIRAFIETAHRVGLKVMLRIGPWAHGEARNGGFPDWLQAQPIAHRTDDPAYLVHARRWYSSIEQQVRGLFHSVDNPDGPIIGIQVENELYDNGPHLSTLRDIAEEVGMRASLWTATGWGGAELPYGRVLPVYAGYSDGFWEESSTGWPAFGVMHFTYNTVRDDLTVGADLRDAPVDVSEGATLGADDPWPFVTCELGGGMAVAYHRRPLVSSDDVAALALTKVGSGSAWQGYYMYHGGTQVIGELSTMQESQETGYPSDLPVRDYDFFAPLGAAGGQRPHFHKLRQQHLMLESFGANLVTLPTTIPDQRDGEPRWAVRGDGQRGFLFANNHQPAIARLDAISDVQFTVQFDDSIVTIPSEPFELQAGAYFAWPLRQPLGSIPFVSASAQLITSVESGGGHVVILGASRGAPVELLLEGVSAEDVSGAVIDRVEGVLRAIPVKEPGVDSIITVADTTFVILDRESAESLWRGRVGGRDTVILWAGGGWFEDDHFVIVRDEAHDTLHAFPPLQDAQRDPASDGELFDVYRFPVDPERLDVLDADFASFPVAPARKGGPSARLAAPTDADFSRDAAATTITIPSGALAGAESALLSIDWTGDVLRVFIGESLIADQFWFGRPLEIDVAPYRDELSDSPITLKAFAWSPDSEVYVDPAVRLRDSEPALTVRSATLRRSRTVAVS